MAIEVDGFSYHHNAKQAERDRIKDVILQKYKIPILRLSTVGSDEKEKIVEALKGQPNSEVCVIFRADDFA